MLSTQLEWKKRQRRQSRVRPKARVFSVFLQDSSTAVTRLLFCVDAADLALRERQRCQGAGWQTGELRLPALPKTSDTQPDTHTSRQANITDRQTDKQTDRQPDRLPSDVPNELPTSLREYRRRQQHAHGRTQHITHAKRHPYMQVLRR